MSQPNYSGKKGGGDRTDSKMEQMENKAKQNRATVIAAYRQSGAEEMDGDVSDLEGSQEEQVSHLPDAPPEVPQGPGPSTMLTRGNAGGPAGAGGDDGSGYEADASVSGASTNSTFSQASQASIQSIASSVADSVASGLPLPDAEHMLIEFVGGVHRLTVAGMDLFNMVAERAGGYGPVASIAFISLLSAKPDLLPTLSLPTIELTGIASQIGLTAAAAAAAAEAAAAPAAPATTGFFSSLTGAATSAAASIGHGITAGVTAISVAIATNNFTATPLTIDHIASMVESTGNKAIGAVITVAEFQNRMVTSLKKLKANWTVKNLQVKGISTLQDSNIETLVTNAVTTHARVLAPINGEQPLNESQLRAAYNGIVNEINNIASPEPVVPAPAPEVIAEQLIENAAPAANDAPADNAPPAAGAGRNTGGGKKNRKSQKKPRKKVTRSKRGKKAARKTKKQSRRKSRGKKHGKKH